eukprot:gnl/Trimastix_PCT/3353.p1 GENE.gnl/Trimastix_PCT/3353~~gnl/Trimastix_PCT/3353.p1  ORF type:complete len:286 (+),score=29.66 gnl/Trimastix_PCT/3353:67-924(+)
MLASVRHLSGPSLSLLFRNACTSCSCSVACAPADISKTLVESEKVEEPLPERLFRKLNALPTWLAHCVRGVYGYRISRPPQGQLYNATMSLLTCAGGGLSTNTFILHTPISWIRSQKMIMTYFASWLLIHKTRDVVYRTLGKQFWLMALIQIVDHIGECLSWCEANRTATDKYGHLFPGVLAGTLMGCGGGAIFGFLEQRTRDKTARSVLSQPTWAIKLAFGAASSYAGLHTLLLHGARWSGPHAHAWAKLGALCFVLSMSGHDLVTRYRARRAQRAEGQPNPKP